MELITFIIYSFTAVFEAFSVNLNTNYRVLADYVCSEIGVKFDGAVTGDQRTKKVSR